MAKATTKASAKSSKSKPAARSAKKSSRKPATKKATKSKAKPAALDQVEDISLEQLDETGNRKTAKPIAKERRKKVSRRRQIDPTTCEREYNDAEIQFMHAMDEYKQLSGRMFPTCSEILEVLTKLGYRQIADMQDIYNPDAEEAKTTDEEESSDCEEAEFCV